MNREDMISWLVRNDLEYVDSRYGHEWLANILVGGFEFEGYANQSDEELRKEILERDEEAFNEVEEN